jgi:hypothetical protein
MSPYYYPNSPVPCFGAMPMIPSSDFNEEMRPMVPMAKPTPKPQMTPSDFEIAPGSPTILDSQYTQGYLKTQIGKRVRITFLIGTNIIQDRAGVLTDVGISYIIINEADSNNPLLCDIYAIKFILFLP